MTHYESIDPKDIKKVFAEYFSINKIHTKLVFVVIRPAEIACFMGLVATEEKRIGLIRSMSSNHLTNRMIDGF